MPNTLSAYQASDLISGREGEIWITIEGKKIYGGAFRQLEASFAKTKEDVNLLGSRATQHKATGWNGTGTGTMYYVTSVFVKLAEEYARTGRDVYFDVIIVNRDETALSAVDWQQVTLRRCNLDSTTIAKIDVDNSFLDESIDFTFEDFSLDHSFKDTPTR